MLNTSLYKQEQLEKRLARMETRLCMLMTKLGVAFEGGKDKW